MTLFQALRWLDELEYVIEALAQQAVSEARAALVELILEAESDAQLDGSERTMLLNTLERARTALLEPDEDEPPAVAAATILSSLTRRLWQQVH